MKQQVQHTHSRKETLRGFVVPEQWDDQFQVTEVLIACNGEREVRVENVDKFPQLLSSTQQAVAVTGMVRQNQRSESILVESYEVLEVGEPD